MILVSITGFLPHDNSNLRSLSHPIFHSNALHVQQLKQELVSIVGGLTW